MGQVRNDALGIGSLVLDLFLLFLFVEVLWYPYFPYFPWLKDMTVEDIILWMCLLAVVSLGLSIAGLCVSGAKKIYLAFGILLSISPFLLYIVLAMAVTAGG
jgi:hypothetical protein